VHVAQSEAMYDDNNMSGCREHLTIFTNPLGQLVVRMSRKPSLHYALNSPPVGNKMHYLSRSWIVSLDLKHTGASFSPNLIDSLCLRVAQVPRSRDVAIFVLTTTQRPITLPLEHVRGVINLKFSGKEINGNVYG
jgi:hypothetical protein